MKKDFQPNILKLQVSLKNKGVFIYYRELCELLRNRVESLKFATEKYLDDYIKFFVDIDKEGTWDELTESVKKDYDISIRNLSTNSQIVLSKSTLKDILSKHYSKDISQVVISSDYEKIFLKLVV